MKNIFKVLGFITIVAVIGFSFTTCDDDTGGGGTSGGTPVPVTGVSLNKTSLSLAVGGSATLTATVAPDNATNKAVTWTSSDATKATVANGVVRAVSAGSATITVKTADGGKTATCTVTVNSPSANKDAKILSTGMEYDTLAAAISAAANGTASAPTEIIILRNISTTSGYIIPDKYIKLTVLSGQNITITAAAGNFRLFSFSNNTNSSSLTLGPTSGGGTLTLNGDNAAAESNRQGVYVYNRNKSFILNDGVTITGFKNSGYLGGGVYVDSGTFTMNGGKIIYNTVNNDNKSYGEGGGVFVSRGTFTMNGGEISNNNASASGGGVVVYSNGTFTMNGGKISGNTSSYGAGVMVRVDSATFTMSGGEILGNTASGNGGGVYTYGTFTMSGGTIYGSNAPAGYVPNTANSGAAVYVGRDGTAKYGDGTNISTTNNTIKGK